MSRFNAQNQTSRQTRAMSPIKTTERTTRTFEGGKAFVRDEKSELFQLAVVNMVGQDTFYESAGDRDSRYVELIHKVAIADPAWLYEMLRWLRGPEGNLRTASLVGAAEFVRARLKMSGISYQDQEGWNRKVINAVLQRPDEPGELLAYWTGKYGKPIPKPIKRGVADAVVRLYNERGYLRYDSDSKGFRFADVIDLVHPATSSVWQSKLFRYALDERHGHVEELPEELEGIRARRTLNGMDAVKRHELARLALRDGLEHSIYWRAMAGQWEWLHSALGDAKGTVKPMSKADQWRLVLPQLGYMALLRNLRNLEEAGLTREEYRSIQDRLADPEQVAKSRQFPFRFWSAHQAVNGYTFTTALEDALSHAMRNLPALDGPSLVLVDTSASMQSGVFDKRSTMSPIQAAALFGVSLVVRNAGSAELYGFASGEFRHHINTGAAALQETQRFMRRVGEVGHGTDIVGAVQRQYQRGKHKRIFVITDGQGRSGYRDTTIDAAVPNDVPVYLFTLGGYRATPMQAGTRKRHEFGGLSDATFKQVPLLEAGESAGWPWQLGD